MTVVDDEICPRVPIGADSAKCQRLPSSRLARRPRGRLEVRALKNMLLSQVT